MSRQDSVNAAWVAGTSLVLLAFFFWPAVMSVVLGALLVIGWIVGGLLPPVLDRWERRGRRVKP
jgi:hypothetical protein